MYKDLWQNTWLLPIYLLHLLPLQILRQALKRFGPGCSVDSPASVPATRLPCRCPLVLQVSQSSTISGGLSQHPCTFGAPFPISLSPVCAFRIAINSVIMKVMYLPGGSSQKGCWMAAPLSQIGRQTLFPRGRISAFFHWPPPCQS